MRYRVDFEAAKFDWGYYASHKIDKLNEEEMLILDDYMETFYYDEEPTADEIDDVVRFELHCCRNSYNTVCGYDTVFLGGDESLQHYIEKHVLEFELGYVEIVF